MPRGPIACHLIAFERVAVDGSFARILKIAVLPVDCGATRRHLIAITI